MKRVGPLDAAWLFVESQQTPMHVGCLQIFSLPPHAPAGYVGDLVRTLRAASSLAPPFSLKPQRSRLGALLPEWVEETRVDMRHHLRHSTLPAPGGENELEDLVSSLQSHELDMSRPLWECHLIEGLAGKRFALLTKIHHSLMDGIGGVRLLEAMLSPSSRRRHLPPPWSPHPGSGQPEHLESAGAAPPSVEHFLRQAWVHLHALPGLYRAAVQFGKAALAPRGSVLSAPYRAPKSRLNGRVSSQRRLVTLQLPLRRVQRLAQRAGVTINDVLLALCAGALRRYLLELGALPRRPLVAGLPVSVRPTGDMSVGTAISFILASLATDLDHPLRRLAAIHRATAAAKAQLQTLERAALTEYTLLLMAPFILKLMTGLGAAGRPVFNLAISNVPGPRRHLYYNGARLEAMYPMSIITHGQALNITALSYAGQLNFGFSACARTLPQLRQLADYTADACAELESLLRRTR